MLHISRAVRICRPFTRSLSVRQGWTTPKGQELLQKDVIDIGDLQNDAVFDSRISRAVKKMNISALTPVQAQLVVPILANDRGVVCRAKTGTGKTLAFVIPSVQTAIDYNGQRKRGMGKVHTLVIAPTRDLALQIQDEYNKILLSDRNLARLCSVRLVIGGKKGTAMRDAPAVVVATPGRLEADLRNPRFRELFSDLKYRIYDEADRLLDQGFEESLHNIDSMLQEAKEGAIDPAQQLRSVLFSATVDDRVDDFSRTTIGSNYRYINCVDDLGPEAHENIRQVLVRTNSLFELHVAAVSDLLRNMASKPNYKAILFAPTVSGCDFLHHLAMASKRAQTALKVDIPGRVLKLHGKMTQGQRDQATRFFRTATTGVLICTDVAARGLDFKNVSEVIQMSPSSEIADYVHKVGRTARAGQLGEATLYLSKNEWRYKTALEKKRGVVFAEEKEYSTFAEDSKALADLMLDEEMVNQYAFSSIGFYRSVVGSYRLSLADLLREIAAMYREFLQDQNAMLQCLWNTLQKMGIPAEVAELIFDVPGGVPVQRHRNRESKFNSFRSNDRSYGRSGSRSNYGSRNKSNGSRSNYGSNNDRQRDWDRDGRSRFDRRS